MAPYFFSKRFGMSAKLLLSADGQRRALRRRVKPPHPGDADLAWQSLQTATPARFCDWGSVATNPATPPVHKLSLVWKAFMREVAGGRYWRGTVSLNAAKWGCIAVLCITPSGVIDPGFRSAAVHDPMVGRGGVQWPGQRRRRRRRGGGGEGAAATAAKARRRRRRRAGGGDDVRAAATTCVTLFRRHCPTCPPT